MCLYKIRNLNWLVVCLNDYYLEMELKFCGCFKCIDYDLLNNVFERR